MHLNGFLETPSIAVRAALDEYDWSIRHGRDYAEAMRRARVAAQETAPGLKDVMSEPICDGLNAECLRRFEWEVETMKQTPFQGMRFALELDVTLTEQREAEERRHAKARDGRQG